ncbi:mannose-P-dolichol utilization defect 1 protein-like [Odontesthes bonariensis]|uniref:mannose-P-dolichol utilization defect 1 protein-like n=1 Tax=Odontesthes bonariensis TaxID=219752 RepID=UPI003F585F60
MTTSPVKDFLVGFLMPKKCYEELLVNFHWHVPCLKFILTKIAGFWIMLDMFLAQLPQLLKILWRGSAEGLSLTSVLLQLYAFSCPVVYAKARNFPFFAWAERLFTLAQTAAIVFLILHYRGETLKALLLLSGFGGAMFLLASYAAAALVTLIHASSLAALIASKAVQSITSYNHGHTDQLSTLSVSLTCTGSLGVVIVSLQETGGSLTTLSHTLSACLSFVLLAQILCYTSSTVSATKKRA